MPGLLIVDAENVRRSAWPNVSREELVRLCGNHAETVDDEIVVVFDGPPPVVAAPPGVRLAGERGQSADDLIARLAAADAVGPVTVVTSDRGLRARLPRTGVELVGGGRFVRSLLDRWNT